MLNVTFVDPGQIACVTPTSASRTISIFFTGLYLCFCTCCLYILSGTATVLLSYSALADPSTVIHAIFQPYKDLAIINGILAENDLVYRSANIPCSSLHYSGCTLRIAIIIILT